MAFVFNKEKVTFRKIAGEVVLPMGQVVVSEAKKEKPLDATASSEATSSTASLTAAVESGFGELNQQFARTPFVVAFQSGWFKFNLCTVHIYYGDDSGAKLRCRIAEIAELVDFFTKRQDKENAAAKGDPTRMENYILLGDFNVVSPKHKTMQALRRRGFEVPKAIDGAAVRTPEDHFYDQIAVRVDDERFDVAAGGLVDMFGSVFRDEDEDRELYRTHVPAKDPEEDDQFAATTPEARYEKWRTWQMSDHRPLWIEIETDFAETYLRAFAEPAR